MASSSASPYLQIALYAAGNFLTLAAGAAAWGIWSLLRDFQEPLLWAWLCSVALKDTRDWLVQELTGQLSTRTLLSLALRGLFFPLLVFRDTIHEIGRLLHRAIEEERQLRLALRRQVKQMASTTLAGATHAGRELSHCLPERHLRERSHAWCDRLHGRLMDAADSHNWAVHTLATYSLFGWHLASALLRNLHAVVRYTQERVEGPDMARRHSHQHHTKNNHHAKRRHGSKHSEREHATTEPHKGASTASQAYPQPPLPTPDAPTAGSLQQPNNAHDSPNLIADTAGMTTEGAQQGVATDGCVSATDAPAGAAQAPGGLPGAGSEGTEDQGSSYIFLWLFRVAVVQQLVLFTMSLDTLSLVLWVAGAVLAVTLLTYAESWLQQGGEQLKRGVSQWLNVHLALQPLSRASSDLPANTTTTTTTIHMTAPSMSNVDLPPVEAPSEVGITTGATTATFTFTTGLAASQVDRAAPPLNAVPSATGPVQQSAKPDANSDRHMPSTSDAMQGDVSGEGAAANDGGSSCGSVSHRGDGTHPGAAPHLGARPDHVPRGRHRRPRQRRNNEHGTSGNSGYESESESGSDVDIQTGSWHDHNSMVSQGSPQAMRAGLGQGSGAGLGDGAGASEGGNTAMDGMVGQGDGVGFGGDAGSSEAGDARGLRLSSYPVMVGGDEDLSGTSVCGDMSGGGAISEAPAQALAHGRSHGDVKGQRSDHAVTKQAAHTLVADGRRATSERRRRRVQQATLDSNANSQGAPGHVADSPTHSQLSHSQDKQHAVPPSPSLRSMVVSQPGEAAASQPITAAANPSDTPTLTTLPSPTTGHAHDSPKHTAVSVDKQQASRQPSQSHSQSNKGRRRKPRSMYRWARHTIVQLTKRLLRLALLVVIGVAKLTWEVYIRADRWVRHVLIDNISGLVSGGLVVGTLLGLAIMAVLVVVQIGAEGHDAVIHLDAMVRGRASEAAAAAAQIKESHLPVFIDAVQDRRRLLSTNVQSLQLRALSLVHSALPHVISYADQSGRALIARYNLTPMVGDFERLYYSLPLSLNCTQEQVAEYTQGVAQTQLRLSATRTRLDTATDTLTSRQQRLTKVQSAWEKAWLTQQRHATEFQPNHDNRAGDPSQHPAQHSTKGDTADIAGVGRQALAARNGATARTHASKSNTQAAAEKAGHGWRLGKAGGESARGDVHGQDRDRVAAADAAAAAAQSAGLAAQAAATAAEAVLELIAPAADAPDTAASRARVQAALAALQTADARNAAARDWAAAERDTCVSTDGAVDACGLESLHGLLLASQARLVSAQEEHNSAKEQVAEATEAATLAERKLRACHALNTVNSTQDPLSLLLTRCMELADRLVHGDMLTVQEEVLSIAEEASNLLSSLRDRYLSPGVLTNPLSHVTSHLPITHFVSQLPGWASDWLHSIPTRILSLLPLHSLLPWPHTTHDSDDPKTDASSVMHAADSEESSTDSHKDTDKATVVSVPASVASQVAKSVGAGSVSEGITGQGIGHTGQDMSGLGETASVSSMSVKATGNSGINLTETVTVIEGAARRSEGGQEGEVSLQGSEGFASVVRGAQGSDMTQEGGVRQGTEGFVEHDQLAVSPTRLLNLAGAAVNLGYQLGAAESVASAFTQLSSLTSATLSSVLGSVAALAGGTTAIALDMGTFAYKAVNMVFTFAVDLSLFVATLLYLLNSGQEPLQRIIFILPLDKQHQDMARRALAHAMQSVFLSAIKLAFFHAGFTWVTLRAAGTHFTTLLTLCSTLLAVLPVLPVWAPVVPAALELALSYGHYASAVALLAVQVLVSGYVDDVIMGEMGGGGYLTGFGVAGGMAVWSNPLKGVLLGPMCLALASAAYHVHAQFVMEGTG